MNKDRFAQIEGLFHQALSYAPEARAAFLAQACAGDEAVRREVEALLAYEHPADSFIEKNALEIAARKISEETAAEATTARLPVMVPAQIGPYQVQSCLGKGGMGEVHLALDTRLQRKVAIKLLPAEFTNSSERVRRFAQEARAASALNHPNILTIHEIGQAEGTHYIVTEYVEGETLRQKIAQAQRMDLPEVMEVALQITAALVAAHEAGIIHRDIKPENVMVRRDGLVKVLDFGLAKLVEPVTPPIASNATTLTQHSTDAGIVLGTPRYMSPEQARGEKVDARSDIFSLGVMLYEMVTGRAPFAGATPSEVIAAILRDDPRPLAAEIPERLKDIIAKALSKDRTGRHQSTKELLADLTQCKQELLNPEKNSVPTIGASIVTSPIKAVGKQRRALLLAFVGLVLIVAAAVYFGFFRRSAIESLAVLPFVNVGANPDTEYLSDGITDSLINKLAQLPQLKVIARSAVRRYKGKEADAQVAGKALGVRAVLTGQVTQRGDDLFINVELVNVSDNFRLWGEEYSYKLANLPAVQSDLARDVSQRLRLQLSSAEQQRLAQRGTDDPEAYELYLKGRHELNGLADNQQTSFGYFQRAVEKDPQFALAWAGLAEAYVAKSFLGATLRLAPKEAYPPAKAAAEKAVGLDDTLVEAHVSLARIAMNYEWDWAKAEREFQRAIALKADDVPAHHFYAHLLVALGRYDEAMVESQRALAVDPLSLEMNWHLGHHYWNTRQYELAVPQLQKVLAIRPNFSNAHNVLGLVYAKQGRYQEAIAELQKTKNMGDFDNRGNLGFAYAVAGQRDEARKLLTQLQEEARTKIVSSYHLALIHAGLGEKEQAFLSLDKAFAEREGNLTSIKADPQVDSLRSDPRFADLLRRMGLTP